MNPIYYQTAGELADAIKNRVLTSEEVVTAHLNQIKSHNDKLNAIVILCEKEAMEKARAADLLQEKGETTGPLHGVPVTVKEVFNVAGLKTTANFPPVSHFRASSNAAVVDQLEKAGAIIIGKTNVPTLLGDYQTNGPIYGRTNNPYHLNCTPGGSTGGGAAAVAAGFSPLEIGSDAGGSIRVPAHFCGLYGLKTTENSVSMEGHLPPFPLSESGVHHMVCVGPMARSIADLKMAYHLIKGDNEEKDTSILRFFPKNKPLKKHIDYKLAWTTSFGDLTADQETRTLIQQLIHKLTEKGFSCSQTIPADVDFKECRGMWGNLYGIYAGQHIPSFYRRFKALRHWKKNYSGHMGQEVSNGFKLNFLQYSKVIKKKSRLVASFENFFKMYDFWICPVSMSPAFRHCKPGTPFSIDDKKVDYLEVCGGFTSIFNVSGHPGITIPIGQSKEGLPIGIQIIGPYWSENELFKIASVIDAESCGFTPPNGYIVYDFIRIRSLFRSFFRYL